jgi:hypothetical protein
MSCDAINSVLEAQKCSTQSQIQYSVLAKQLETQRQTGDAASELLAAAVQLSKEAGKGASFDSLV